jgi:hypothetical protein
MIREKGLGIRKEESGIRNSTRVQAVPPSGVRGRRWIKRMNSFQLVITDCVMYVPDID